MIVKLSDIRDELFILAEEDYKNFASSLIPGTDNLIGVRIPKIRNIAKRIAKANPNEYLKNANDEYFEEIMLQGLVIGNMKCNIEKILDCSEKFIPKINNWSLCDSFCAELKTIKENKERVWEFIEPYWRSNRVYDVRFAVVVMLDYYIDKEHLELLFKIFNYIKNDNYYVKSAVAWAVSVCFVKFPDRTFDFLKNNKLDDETFNKSLQKIMESLRVDKDKKEIIKLMKR